MRPDVRDEVSSAIDANVTKRATRVKSATDFLRPGHRIQCRRAGNGQIARAVEERDGGHHAEIDLAAIEQFGAPRRARRNGATRDSLAACEAVHDEGGRSDS